MSLPVRIFESWMPGKRMCFLQVRFLFFKLTPWSQIGDHFRGRFVSCIKIIVNLSIKFSQNDTVFSNSTKRWIISYLIPKLLFHIPSTKQPLNFFLFCKFYLFILFSRRMPLILEKVKDIFDNITNSC